MPILSAFRRKPLRWQHQQPTQPPSPPEDDHEKQSSPDKLKREASTFDPTKLHEHTAASPGSNRTLPFEPGSWFLAVAGLCLTFIAGFAFIGFSVHLTRDAYISQIDVITGDTGGVWYVNFSSTRRSLIDLGLNVVVTICTESVGMIHSVAQRWRLASEGNLDFSANLRLFAPRGKRSWWSPLGPIANGAHGIALVLSYVTASMVFLPVATGTRAAPYFPRGQAASYIPSAILGTCFIVQGILALAALYTVKVPTWSNNCLDVVGAAIHHGYVTPVPNRCLRSLNEDANPEDQTPIYPSNKHIAMWRAHRRVRRVVYFVWLLMPAVILWLILVVVFIIILPKKANAVLGRVHWNLVPQIGIAHAGDSLKEESLGLAIGWLGDLVHNSLTNKQLPVRSLLIFIIIIAAIQACLTIGLNCCELIVNLARDEATWRACGSPKGGHQSDNSLLNAMKNWQTVSLLILKPFVHWLYSNCVVIQAGYGMIMLPIQLFYLFLGLVLLSAWATVVARRPITGVQPVAYGHIQTLANLVDNWSRSIDEDEPKKGIPRQIYRMRNWRRLGVGGRLYWGHKSRSSETGVCHAGTSHQPLSSIRSAVLYAMSETSYADTVEYSEDTFVRK